MVIENGKTFDELKDGNKRIVIGSQNPHLVMCVLVARMKEPVARLRVIIPRGFDSRPGAKGRLNLCI